MHCEPFTFFFVIEQINRESKVLLSASTRHYTRGAPVAEAFTESRRQHAPKSSETYLSVKEGGVLNPRSLGDVGASAGHVHGG